MSVNIWYIVDKKSLKWQEKIEIFQIWTTARSHVRFFILFYFFKPSVFFFKLTTLLTESLPAPSRQMAVVSTKAILSCSKKTQTTTRKSPNQDGGARDSISTVHGSQSPRISHPEGKRKLELARTSSLTVLLCPKYTMCAMLFGKWRFLVNLIARPANLTVRG